MRPLAVFQEVVCETCHRRHSNIRALCLKSGGYVIGPLARMDIESEMHDEGGRWDPFLGALKALDYHCGHEHRAVLG